jgi:ribosomal protein L7/L12|tara:strand:+ start:2193 stop:2582 length:390 start_codon:yes stop_codon:yes gene_type:complete
MKISDALMDAVQEFYAVCKTELGEEFGGDQAIAMFDALDPSIRGGMLMTMFAGDSTKHVLLQYDVTGDQDTYISAIKTLRMVFGWELRTAKSAVDNARDHGQYDLGVTDRAQRTKLTTALSGSSWHIRD